MRQQTDRIKAAEERRKQVLGLVRGAKLRVGLLEAEAEGQGLEALTATLGIAMADYAMMAVINGNVPIKDAGQAAQIAKLGIEVHKLTSGTSDVDKAEMTPAERDEYRKNLVAAIRTLSSDLAARARAADDVTEADVDAVPPSPRLSPPLAIVGGPPPVPAQEA
jgi:hypothetical protein